MKVLLIDDSQAARDIAKARLAKEELEIVCAADGISGIEAARKECPDLVLLDVDMPGLSGFEVCRILISDLELRNVPIIFLTGSTDVEDRVRGLDLGAVDYVTKPFDAFELRARVRAALRTKHLHDMLITHANVDPLTELPNRRALMTRLGEEWCRAQRSEGRLAFVMADVDRFKLINDTFGHQVGDKFLQAAAGAFTNACRCSDLVARYGGEEIAVLAPETTAATAAVLAERIRSRTEELSVRAGPHRVQATVSLGVADSEGVEDPEGLIRAADEALYHAKNEGRNRVATAEHQHA